MMMPVPDRQSLRLQTPGIASAGDSFSIVVDGHAITARPGESVAASLTAARVLRLRTSERGGERGMYCGMGACFECLVTIDGVPGQRACLTKVRASMRIDTRRGPDTSAAVDKNDPVSVDGSIVNAVAADDSSVDALAVQGATEGTWPMHCDVAIIGAGPAGLSAAKVASAHGLSVVLADERAAPGGQYFKPLAAGYRFSTSSAFDRQFAAGSELVANVRALGATIFEEATVWDVRQERGGSIVVRFERHGVSQSLRARRLLVAAGAYERPWPVPGWTLPGAMTTGAVQTLARAYRVAAGERILIAGNGPLNLQVAAEIARGGGNVVAVAEAADRFNVNSFNDLWAMLRLRPALVRDGMGYLRALRRHAVPVLFRRTLVRIEGGERVQRAVLAKVDRTGKPIAGSEQAYDVDVVAAGYGFLPSVEITRLLGCEHAPDPRRGDELVPVRDDDGRTSIPEVFVAGDCGGAWGAAAAIASGDIAGAAMVRDLSDGTHSTSAGRLATRVRKARKLRESDLAFQRHLWNIYSAPLHPEHCIDAQTVVCRCENVVRAAVERRIDNGDDLGKIKRATRCGMGRCQGRYCFPAISALLKLRTPTGGECGDRDVQRANTDQADCHCGTDFDGGAGGGDCRSAARRRSHQ